MTVMPCVCTEATHHERVHESDDEADPFGTGGKRGLSMQSEMSTASKRDTPPLRAVPFALDVTRCDMSPEPVAKPDGVTGVESSVGGLELGYLDLLVWAFCNSLSIGLWHDCRLHQVNIVGTVAFTTTCQCTRSHAQNRTHAIGND
jgi:hypothetical protein